MNAGSSPASQQFAHCLSLMDWYGEIAIPEDQAKAIAADASSLGLRVSSLIIESEDFFVWTAQHASSLPPPDPDAAPAAIGSILGDLRLEKLLEYYLTTHLHSGLSNAVVVDVGCGNQTTFLEKIALPLGAECFAIDPALSGRKEPDASIHYLSGRISEVGLDLPLVDLVTAHCSFEMFSPLDMASVLALAEARLRPGGKLIILPLYMASRRTVYADSSGPVPGFTPEDRAEEACRIGVEDFWGLTWTEWLSPQALLDRLVRPFPSLRFTLLRVVNSQDVTPVSFLRFIGKWEKM